MCERFVSHADQRITLCPTGPGHGQPPLGRSSQYGMLEPAGTGVNSRGGVDVPCATHRLVPLVYRTCSYARQGSGGATRRRARIRSVTPIDCGELPR